jgi:hypothetical protein
MDRSGAAIISIPQTKPIVETRKRPLLPPIFGKIRYMNAEGLSRKFDAPKYVEKIQALIPQC